MDVSSSIENTKPLLVQIRLRNNRLITLRRSFGFTSQLAAARAIGIPPQILNRYENLRLTPTNRHGLRQSAAKVAEFYCVSIDEIWPEITQAVAQPLVERPADAQDLQVENNQLLQRALRSLPPRDSLVLKLRARDFTLDEIGQQLNLSRERVRQIERRALTKARKNAAP